MYAVGFIPNKLAEPETVYKKIFLAHNWNEMAEARRAWLKDETPGSPWSSEPMRFLMDNLREQVRRSILGDDNPRPVKLKHESFLAVLDEALTMQGWPEKDHLRNVLERLSGRADEGGAGVPAIRAHSRSWTPPMRHAEPPNPFDMPGSDTAPRKRSREADAPDLQDEEDMRAGLHRRVQAVAGEEEAQPKKRRRLDEPQRNRPAPAPTPIPRQRLAASSSTASATRVLQTQRANNSAVVHQTTQGRSCPQTRALLSKVIRSRCCGFWRHLLRR